MSKHLNDSADSFKSQPEVQAELKTSNEAELRERAKSILADLNAEEDYERGDLIRDLLARLEEKDKVIEKLPVWHDASDPPEDSCAVYCVREVVDSAWINLGTYQHGGWRDTNTFEPINPDRWTRLPLTPKQQAALAARDQSEGGG